MLNSVYIDSMQKISPHRNEVLFTEFLPKGYAMTTLSSVTQREKVLKLKLILGTIITLYDDFADNPHQRNSSLLSILYEVPFQEIEIKKLAVDKSDIAVLKLAKNLFSDLYGGLREFNRDFMIEIFEHDLRHFFLANQYSEIITKYPKMSNALENKLYLHHNMGILMAGMIDLMSLGDFDDTELSDIRTLLLLGQRAGRISNILTTFEREKKEGDVTNEMFVGNRPENLVSKRALIKKEFKVLCREIDRFSHIRSFSTTQYREGIENLHRLHESFFGLI